MNPDDTNHPSDDIRLEYSAQLIEGAQRGKYVSRFQAGTNLVLLDPDVASTFRDAKAVNEALRLLQKVAISAVEHP